MMSFDTKSTKHTKFSQADTESTNSGKNVTRNQSEISLTPLFNHPDQEVKSSNQITKKRQPRPKEEKSEQKTKANFMSMLSHRGFTRDLSQVLSGNDVKSQDRGIGIYRVKR